jgi:PiT family inorganic phosphate transporter
VTWGGIEDGRPVGVFGVLISLAVAPVVGFVVAVVVETGARRVVRRATVRWTGPTRGLQWATSAWLAFSHGSNDAQKAVGIIAALLLAGGVTSSFTAPLWSVIACSLMLTLGTLLGGWPIIRTIGRRIFRLRPMDGLVSQASSAGVILGASLLGAPVSTTQVVSSSVVGIGVGRKRRRHVHWLIVRDVGLAWVTTMPAAAGLAILALPLWRWVS